MSPPSPFTRSSRLRRLLLPFLAALTPAIAAPGPFFDPAMPVHATPVAAGGSDVIARGLLVRAGPGSWVVFDQDLLRPALWFDAAAEKEPVSLKTMAQASWRNPTAKAGTDHPRPANPGTRLAPPLPGVGGAPAEVLADPRPVYGSDPGRGGLEAHGRKFLGYRIAASAPVLSYRCGETVIHEWYRSERDGLARHLAAGPGEELVFLVAAGKFDVRGKTRAVGESRHVSSNHPGLTFETRDDLLLARLAASARERRVTLRHSAAPSPPVAATPPVPADEPPRLWPGHVSTRLRAEEKSGPGWTLDRLELPVENPWGRRVRPADLAFPAGGKTAVLTFGGDVWMLESRDRQFTWRRFAAGLCEPLAIGRIDGVLQVFTRHGLVRLIDSDGNGEADFYQNHSSLIHQTASTRGYPLDMEIDADGRTWCGIGGIATANGSLTNKAPANPHSGAILSISPDGDDLEIFAIGTREPFIARHPRDGRLALTDQQGHWVPSSGVFGVRRGANFGYGGRDHPAPSPPAVWIPHEYDSSSGSPLWMAGSAFAAWEGGLLDLSYGNGRLFLVRPGRTWPADCGAVIPLGIATGLPLLHGRLHPDDGSLWLAGFRIYDSRVEALGGIARLRPTGEASAAPVDARIFRQGVALRFDGEIDPDSIDAAGIRAREWQYRRTAKYGSPRYRRDGSRGVDPLATGRPVLSKDNRGVFVPIPDLKPTMQLELVHPFAVSGAGDGPRRVAFSARELGPVPWAELGFDPPRLDDSAAAIRRDGTENVEPTAALGKQIATRFGCIACHSTDGTTEGHSGPTWKGVYGSRRVFADGSAAVADEDYLRTAILDPDAEILEGYQVGMASYAGVLDDAQIDSLILYIQSLR